jgi:hypothetical protein
MADAGPVMSDAGAVTTDAGAPVTGNDGGAAPPIVSIPDDPRPFCERWKESTPKDLPGFATDSQCFDFTAIPRGDVPCSGAGNDSAKIAAVYLGQTHLAEPTSERFTQNDIGEPLDPTAQLLKFRLISHRPSLLKIGVTGSGTSPEVKVTGSRAGVSLGSFCLKGPTSLPSKLQTNQTLKDSFTVSLPADWIQPGLELEINAGGASRKIPASDLAVAGGLRQLIVNMPIRGFGDHTDYALPEAAPVMARIAPVRSLVWARFPVAVEPDPFVVPSWQDYLNTPPRVGGARDGSYDELEAGFRTVEAIQAANGQQWDTTYLATSPQGMGLGGGNVASARNWIPLARHELCHAFAFPSHLEDDYKAHKYPYAYDHMGGGGGVGPFWAYIQLDNAFRSPTSTVDPTLTRHDAFAGGDEADAFYGHFTAQRILDAYQSRSFWDFGAQRYAMWYPARSEYVAATDAHPEDDHWYGNPIQRDVPVYTIWGTYSDLVAQANTIQKPLHYRGHLVKVMDPTDDQQLQWMRDHPGFLCGYGCDYTVRVTFDTGKTRTAMLKQAWQKMLFWAVNVPDEGHIVKVEFFRRDFKNIDDASAGSIRSAHGNTFLSSATLVRDRTF